LHAKISTFAPKIEPDMTKRITFFSLLATLAMTVACSGGAPTPGDTTPATEVNDTTGAADNSIYGLACDGCNDTIVVFLRMPYRDTDPDTLDVLEASRAGHIYGTPRIGDKLAIIRNADDTTVADMVVSTNALQAEWCYRVKPTLRERADGRHLQLTDSLRQMLMIEREYSLVIKPDSLVFSKGFGNSPRTSDDRSDVVYPKPRRYRQWYVRNGRLMLAEAALDSVGGVKTLTVDTADFVKLTEDTLVLRFADGEHGYYKKVKSEE
jgi:hypothetical protein